MEAKVKAIILFLIIFPYNNLFSEGGNSVTSPQEGMYCVEGNISIIIDKTNNFFEMYSKTHLVNERRNYENKKYTFTGVEHSNTVSYYIDKKFKVEIILIYKIKYFGANNKYPININVSFTYFPDDSGKEYEKSIRMMLNKIRDLYTQL